LAFTFLFLQQFYGHSVVGVGVGVVVVVVGGGGAKKPKATTRY
jgi:hypothetical protein